MPREMESGRELTAVDESASKPFACEPSDAKEDAFIIEDIEIEEVSIDGICGVY